MKNLKLLSAQRAVTIAGQNFCYDFDKKGFYATPESLYSLEKNSSKISLCAELATDVPYAEIFIVGMEFLFETNSIFIASSCGELYIYNIDEKEIRSEGLVESCVETFAWSPDQEFLVILTGASTLILMTKDFDVIIEKSLCTDEFGESKPINVGWGSKTTQFHGSEGKGAALVKQKEPKQALSYDDHKPRISWRKDGDYFVTSSIDADKGYRMLRMWSQEGVLQFTSEIVEGLEEPICWRPQGNLIACSQQCPNKHKIIFFEKNGLQHGEFVLPFKPNTFKVSTLSWNSDSSILLIVAEEIVNPVYSQVMLWTSSNYHWYLKQRFQLDISSPDSKLISKWSSFHPNELHCFNQMTGEIYQFKWSWEVSHSPGDTGCEDSIVASIDNENLLISPFGKLVVPPPLCAYMYSFTSSIQSVFFSRHFSVFGVDLGNFKLALFQKDPVFIPVKDFDCCNLKLVAAGGNGFKSQIHPYSFCGLFNLKLPASISAFGLCHWTWVKESRLLCIGYCKIDSSQRPKYCILSFDLPFMLSDQKHDIFGRLLVNLETSVNGMCSNSDGTSVAIQEEDGKVLKLALDERCGALKPWLCDNGKNLVFPQLCSNMSIISICGKDYLLGLSDKYNLFCNEIEILPNCTSYYIHDEFLLATTVDHMLKCFSRQFDLTEAIKNNCPLRSKVQSQRIEKGARIIIAPAKSTKVILQMPRGNLETIHPRSLVISAICKYLDDLKFGKAFELSKVHRIDLNILYDHSPKKFIENIDKMIDQIDSPNDLNLFLASLKNENICRTMYPLTFERSHDENSDLLSKINVVCDAFRKVLETKNDNRFYLTIMATYAKKEPSELDQALLRLKTLKDSNNSNMNQNLVDSALNFLLYLVDVEALRITALGTYDLETTIMVEQKSQKDPKEFLPFYNDLQKMEENYRKYKIDVCLQRYKRALVNISRCDDHFDECLQLIKDQRLYLDALNLFPESSDRYKTVWKEYGNYLMEKRYYDEAGLVFTRCGEHENALLAYKESVNWQMALCSASSLNYTEDKIISFSQELAKKLKSHHKHLDASYLLEHYVKDPEESIVTLIEGCEWNMALLMMSKYRRHDIAETHLKPALQEYHLGLKLDLEQISKSFSTHLERLKCLRTKKKIETEQSTAMKFAEDDLFSDTGSVTDAASSCAESKQMSGSIMTRKSSKSRRKQKLKKYRLKEGSADEDLALIVALAEIVTKVDTMKDSFLNTLKAMVQFGHDKSAKELQEQMCLICKTIEKEMSNIWIPTENSNPSPEMKFGPESTVNSITASLQQKSETAAQNSKDPELTAPAWRNIDLTLQMFN